MYCACVNGTCLGAFRVSAEAYCLLFGHKFGQLSGPHGYTEAGTTDWGGGYGDKAARAARAGVRDRLTVCGVSTGGSGVCCDAGIGVQASIAGGAGVESQLWEISSGPLSGSRGEGHGWAFAGGFGTGF